jgi:hypothetical protein
MNIAYAAKHLGRIAILLVACGLLFLQLWYMAALYWWEGYEAFSEAFCGSMRLSWYFRWWLPIPLTVIVAIAVACSLALYRRLGLEWWYIALPLLMASTVIPLYFGATQIVCDWHIYGRFSN